ncbi:glyoxalase [Acidimangrovimonas pyrenivorans]|uniref:Glyoxalase n=1 Tax=Acidimangrovimonas pyrenivorans TaxID=2030798 RepID=A0ABV7ABF9_9RHOB
MDYETVDARDFGHALTGLTVNLLVRDVRAEAAFLAGVLGLAAHRLSADFAIMEYGGQVFQLHADRTYAAHPLPGLLPEAGPRGAGIELRLHETDPDAAAARAAAHDGAMVLQAPVDKPPHGLREAVILSPSGYAWVPSRRMENRP